MNQPDRWIREGWVESGPTIIKGDATVRLKTFDQESALRSEYGRRETLSEHQLRSTANPMTTVRSYAYPSVINPSDFGGTQTTVPSAARYGVTYTTGRGSAIVCLLKSVR